jgi:hypothetical protein
MNLDALIAEDWNYSNLQGICRALNHTFSDVDALCDVDRNPCFSTPNRVFALGYNRWIIADYWMDQACKLEWIKGIKPEWEKNTKSAGPIRTLVLHGTHTKLSVVHLAHPEETPRDSRMRYEGRLNNQNCPYLLGWDESAIKSPSAPIELVLVYGDKSAEFAFLRAYNNSEDLTSYRDVTSNLFTLSPSIRIDGEIVPDIKIDLLPPDGASEEDQDEGLGSASVQ